MAASQQGTPALSEPESTRERILSDAARLFAIHGYRGTTTRAIAAAADIRQPSLFHHFASKRAILEELLRVDLDGLVSVSRQLVTGPGSAAARLYKCIWWDLTDCIGSPHDLRGLSAGNVLDEPAFVKWRRDREELQYNIVRMVEQGVQAGEFAPCDPGIAREVITSLGVETVRLHGALSRNEQISRPHNAAAFVIRALLAEPSELPRVREEAERLAVDATPAS